MPRHRRLAAVLVAVIVAGFAAQRADAALAAGVNAQKAHAASASCWADISFPAHIGSNTEATATWQCSPGVQQQIAPLISLTSPTGTRYTASTQCYNTTYCAITVSAPWSSNGNPWTARAEYAYVVDYDGVSSYFFGGSASAYLPY